MQNNEISIFEKIRRFDQKNSERPFIINSKSIEQIQISKLEEKYWMWDCKAHVTWNQQEKQEENRDDINYAIHQIKMNALSKFIRL